MSDNRAVSLTAARIKNPSVSCQFGKVYIGHGLKFVISGDCLSSPIRESGWSLNVHGDIFKALPSALGPIAKMILPLRVRLDKFLIDYHAGKVSFEMTLGAKKLSHERVKSVLQGIIDKGDPKFPVELCNNESGEVLVIIFTQASLILQSLMLKDSKSILSSKPYPIVQRRQDSGLRKIRWILFPLLFTFFICALYASPPLVMSYLPQLWDTKHLLGVQSVLPPTPAKLSDAFTLGGLHETAVQRLETHMNSTALNFTFIGQNNQTYEPLIKDILLNATRILGRDARKMVTMMELLGMLEEIKSLESRRSITTRVCTNVCCFNVIIQLCSGAWIVFFRKLHVVIGNFGDLSLHWASHMAHYKTYSRSTASCHRAND
eukprot:m.237573 g.237573  ORF g.237573 m.237573 type:complete len:376 (-) comp16057_c0_seq26:2484-3611(-)